jgi:hypothetical protein
MEERYFASVSTTVPIDGLLSFETETDYSKDSRQLQAVINPVSKKRQGIPQKEGFFCEKCLDGRAESSYGKEGEKWSGFPACSCPQYQEEEIFHYGLFLLR